MDLTRTFDNLPPNPRSAGHRRALSESFVRLPDDFLFDSDPDFNISDIDFPSLSDDNVSGGRTTVPPAIPVEYGVRSDAMVANHGGGNHLRSLSVDAGFFDAMGFHGAGVTGGVAPEKRVQHRRNGYVDGEASLLQEESAGLLDNAKKAMSADKLAELALIDPKRAKRILANRQSAARSKDRKILYTGELERKVQTLQTEATALSAQVTLLQRDTTGLTSENRELKLRLQAMEQQAHLRDALNDALKEEVQRLKMATGQIPNGNEGTFNRLFELSIPPFYGCLQQLPDHGGALQAQQLHISFNDHTAHDSMELM